jgi:DUF4097 and DUF4098 domain-containing protein YvlB
MKISIKLILLTGVIFLIVGVIGVKAVIQSGDLHAGLTNVDLEKKMSSADIQNLTIESDVAGIVFAPSADDEIRVHVTGYVSEQRKKETTIDAAMNGKDTWKVQVKTQNNNFHIGLNIADIKSFIFMEKEQQLHVEVSLPQKAYDEIHVKTDTGSIELADIESNKLRVQADTGSISVGTFSGSHIDLQTDTGAITVDKFQGNQMNLQTDTGRIIVKEGEGNARLKTSTGSIEASLRTLADKVDVETNTGSVRLKLDSIPDSVQFDISNDTGHIDFQVPNVNYEEKEKHSVKGKIGTGSSSVKVQTDTGSIEVRG